MRRLLVGVLLVASTMTFCSRPAAAAARCGPLDRPETGIPGEVPLADVVSGRAARGYNCGVAVVGYNNLRRRGGNANMAWSGHCAYVTGAGIAVVDVSDATHPNFVRTLHGPGSNETIETIAAVDAPDRHLLVAGRYGLIGNRGLNGVRPVDIWDTTDCARPKKLSTAWVPKNVHGLTLTADGRRLFTTLPVQVTDISDPRRPRYLGNVEEDLRPQGQLHLEYAHEAVVSPDGNRLYIGGQISGDEELMIIDIRDWPRRKAKILGRTNLPGHSIRPMTINGKPFLLNSDESIASPTAKGCLPELMTPYGGVAQPYLTDISNERAPKVVGKFRLPINEPKNCVRETAAVAMDASVHYHDVDDPQRTTFALLSMFQAGMRIVDVREPAHPREVAYFNPARFKQRGRPPKLSVNPLKAALYAQGFHPLDIAWAHIRYNPKDGLIWLATSTGGFWVLELEPQVRATLGLPPVRSYHPRGGEPRPAASRFHAPMGGSSAMYCTLNMATASLS